jgi:DNA polymerase-3 subunit chi
MEVSFYQLLTTPLEKALPKLVEKIYHGGYRALIVCDTQERVEILNAALWTFSPGSFIPHGYEAEAKRQPIWLSTQLENVNEANLVIITSGIYIQNSDFKKCLDMFEGNDKSSLEKARQRYTAYKTTGLKVTFWQQSEAGRWGNVPL